MFLHEVLGPLVVMSIFENLDEVRPGPTWSDLKGQLELKLCHENDVPHTFFSYGNYCTFHFHDDISRTTNEDDTSTL